VSRIPAFVCAIFFAGTVWAAPVGISVGYLGGLSGLGDHYDGAPLIRLTIGAGGESSTFRRQIEVFGTRFTDGTLATKPYIRPGDPNTYSPVNTSADMTVIGALVTTGGTMRKRGFVTPIWQAGVGWYYYNSRTAKLMFPDQGKSISEPLDLAITMDTMTDRRFSIGGTAGLGLRWNINSDLGIELTGRYHLFVGELRSFQAWGLEKAFPLQAVELSLGVIRDF
jgi:hypothetical protein